MSRKTNTQTRVDIPPGSVMDIHICGQCRSHFTSINTFIEHKQKGCTPAPPSAAASVFIPGQGTSSPAALLTNATTSAGNKRMHQSNHEIDLEVAPRGVSTSVSGSQSSNVASSQETGSMASSSSPYLLSKAWRRLTSSPNVQITTPEASPQLSRPVPEKRYKCDIDGCTFSTAHFKDIKRHLRIHTGEKPYACHYCEKKFSRQDKLKIHHRIHSGEKPFKCDQCEYACVDGGSLKKHMRIHNDERPFKCQICEYRSRNSSQLIVHLRTHTGDTPFHCQQCDSKFKINSDLTRHMRTHTGDKPFHCEHCDYKCSLKSNLNNHIKTNHGNDKRFQCDECGFACCTKRQMKQHSHSHATTKPIKCLECSFQCYNKVVFRRHERKHSDDRPYKCNYCDFDSKYPGHVPVHVKRRHPETIEKKRPNRKDKARKSKTAASIADGTLQVVAKKPFQCDKCAANFMRQDSLFSHRRQHARVNLENREGIDRESMDRESMAYAVLQLQQYSGKNSSSQNPNATVGGIAEKSSDVLHSLLNQSSKAAPVMQTTHRSQDSVTLCLPTPDESHTGDGDTHEEVIEVQFATGALSEVEVSSDNPKVGGVESGELHNSVMIVQTNDDPNSSHQTITLEFPEQDIVLAQIPSTSMTSNTQASEVVAVVHSPSKAVTHSSERETETHYFQVETPLPPAASQGGRQTISAIQQEQQVDSIRSQTIQNQIGQTITVPQHLFNVIQSQLAQQGSIPTTQRDPIQIATPVLPVQTTTSAASRMMSFAQPAIAVAQQPTVFIPGQQQVSLQQETQGDHGNVQVTYTTQSSTPLQTHSSQARWQTIQCGQEQQTLVRKPGQQQLSAVPMMTFTLPSQQQQQVQLQQHVTQAQQTVAAASTVSTISHQQQHPITMSSTQTHSLSSSSTASVTSISREGGPGMM